VSLPKVKKLALSAQRREQRLPDYVLRSHVPLGIRGVAET